MRARGKRLDRLGGALDAAPVLPHVLDEAYEWFTGFGELPDEDHVAEAVMQRALRGGDDDVGAGRSAGRMVAHSAHQHFLTVREPLFDEALDENPWSRRMARTAICVEVAHGGNVESPGFASHHGLPIYGKVSMHVMGWPRMLVKPPYEDQAKRLLVRLDNVRARVNSDNDWWLTAQAEAELRFYATGELPKDELHRDGVLVSIELDLLWAHHMGRDASEGLALFKRSQWGEPEEKEAAVRELCELAAARRLMPPKLPGEARERRKRECG